MTPELTLYTLCCEFVSAFLHGTAGEKEDKESLLFSALTKFMMKSALSSISEIERSVVEPLCMKTLLKNYSLSITEIGKHHA